MFIEQRIAELERGVALIHAKLDGRDAKELFGLESNCQAILLEVAADARVEVRQILGKSRFAQFVRARQLCAWLIQRTTSLSTTQIAKVLKWKCHANVSHAARAIENRRDTEPVFKAKTDAWLAKFREKQP